MVPIERERKQSNLKQLMDNVSHADNNKIDEILAENIYGCNISFATCESKYFKRLIHALRPAYSPPNRKKIAGPLLEKIHHKIEDQNQNLVQKMNKEAVLLIDGWMNSSSNRHNVNTMMSTADDQKVFLESYDISESNGTSLNLCTIEIRQSIWLKQNTM